MYKVMVQDDTGNWSEEGHSDSFSNAWDYARVLKKQGKTVKVVGPEGEWEVK